MNPLDQLKAARDDIANLGPRLIAAREAAGLRSATLARAANVSPSTMRRIERGESVPWPRTLDAIIAVLETSICINTKHDVD